MTILSMLALLLMLAFAAPLAAAPQNLQITWTDQSDNEDGFVVQMTGPSDPDFVEIARVGANVSVVAVTIEAAVGWAYSFRAYAFNAAGNSGFSNTAVWVAPESGDLTLEITRNP